MIRREVKPTMVRPPVPCSLDCCRILATVGILLVCAVSPTFAQDRPGLLNQLGDIIGDVIKPPEPIRVRAAVAVDMPVAVNQGGQRNSARVRQQRLDAWCLSLEDSLAHDLDLSDDQRDDLQKLLIKQSAINHQRWKAEQNQNQNRGNQLVDTTPILFAGSTGPTRRISRAVDKAMASLLSEDKQALYTELKTKRKQRIGDWFAQRAVAVIDAELFFSDTQRKACFDELRPHTERRSNGLFAFHRYSHYLPYEALPIVQTFRILELTPAQESRLKDLRSNASAGNQITLTLTSNATDQNEKQLHEAYQTARTQFLNAAAVRAQFLTTRLELPQDQARYLETAGKGVTIRSLNQWKKQTRKQMQQYAANPRFGAGMRIGLPGPDIRSLEHDQLWKRAVNTVCENADADLFDRHDQQVLDGASAFILATLDRELTLREDQVETVRKLVDNTTPHLVHSNQYYYLELAMFARTLVLMEEEQLAEVLSEPQMKAWKLIKSAFRFRGKGRAEFTTRNGDVHLNLTKPSNGTRRPGFLMNVF